MSSYNSRKARIARAEERAERLDKSYDDLNKQKDALIKQHGEDIDAVIDALGVRATYPDVEKTGKRWNTMYGGYGAQMPVQEDYTYTLHGRVAFLADVRAAAAGKRGSASAKRLAEALKAHN
jgi:hypothetical protein